MLVRAPFLIFIPLVHAYWVVVEAKNMLKPLQYIALLAGIFCCSVVAEAQHRSIKFQNISIKNGLSQSYVNAIVQDRQGFIWIGTQDGLNQFDGYTFNIFKSSSRNPNSISNSYIHSVCEDADGMIWAGTDQGLNLFNKSTLQFKQFLPNRIVLTVKKAPQGKLWVGTEASGLYLFDPKTGDFEHFQKGVGNNSLPTNSIRCLYTSSSGDLWIGTLEGLCRYNPETKDFLVLQHSRNNPLSLTNDVVSSITEDSQGNLWVGTNSGLNKMEAYGDNYFFKRYYLAEALSLQEQANTVTYLYQSSFGALWVGTRGAGLVRIMLDDGEPTFSNYATDEFDPNSLINNSVLSINEDRSGNLWIGTYNGISKFDPEKQGFSHVKYAVNNPESLKDKNVWSFADDQNNNLFIGSRTGVTRINRNTDQFYYYGRKTNNPNRLGDNSVLSLLVDSRGEVWLGMTDGVFMLKNWQDTTGAYFEPVVFRDSSSSFQDNRTYSLMEDSKGFVWIGTREGLSRIDPRTGNFQFFQHDAENVNTLGDNIVRCIYEMSDGSIWVATDGGGLHLVQETEAGIVFHRYQHDTDDPHTLSSDMVISLQEGKDGTLWVGTYGGGLNKFDPKTGAVEVFTETHGLANNVVYGVLADDDGNLWLSTNNGLCKLNVDDMQFRNYEENDGLQSNEFNIGAYFKNQRGEFFFGGINGFNYFFPEEIRNNTRAPEVVITKLLLFNKEMPIGEDKILKSHVSMSDEVVLDYYQNNLTIEFSALHFTFPEQNKYRYILENHDPAYSNVGDRRRAYFTNIPPGEYVFRVSGSNSDGIWSGEEATLTIIITPPFWQTWWFTTLWIALLITVTYGGFRYRLSLIKTQKIKLERLVNIRTQEVQHQKTKIEQQKEALQVEKDKSEQLLLNILPEETVEELKAKGKATARNYPRATVMFTDIKGFTQVAENIPATELVARLDAHFIRFDRIIEKYGIEKIKTIGDAYMCAGGVPIRNKSNPIDTVLAGLEIQRYMDENMRARKERGEDYWDLRVGIHTGEIIAGVIGTKRFAYDIWGDTVNVANRLETSCEPGMVNISGETYQIVKPLFECQYRGKVAAKNKGEIDMYYVERIRPELSLNGEGIEPNQKFKDYVNLILYSNINYRNAERFIVKLLKENLPDNLHYHGVHHTLDVTRAAESLALLEGITGEELYLLKTASLYHDAGFVKQYSQNEPLGVEMSREILPNFGYTPEQIDIIDGLIMATAIPHSPNNHLQQIMCDADLDYLGRDDFNEISEDLKKELMERDLVKNDRAWDEIQVKFFKMHKFFTKSAISLRQEGKMRHLAEIEERLANNRYDDQGRRLDPIVKPLH